MTITELRNKRAKTWEAAKAFLDSHRNADGFLSAEDDTTYTNMENEITAPEDGTVASINVGVGDSVESGDTLATLN